MLTHTTWVSTLFAGLSCLPDYHAQEHSITLPSYSSSVKQRQNASCHRSTVQLSGCTCWAHAQQICGLQMDHLTERNSSLLRRVAEAEGANAAVKGQLQEFCQKLRLTQVDNSLLQQQVAFLQKQQKVRASWSVLSHCDCLVSDTQRCVSHLTPWHLSFCSILDFLDIMNSRMLQMLRCQSVG